MHFGRMQGQGSSLFELFKMKYSIFLSDIFQFYLALSKRQNHIFESVLNGATEQTPRISVWKNFYGTRSHLAMV